MLPTNYLLIDRYIFKQDLALNNPQELICHKTQPNHPLLCLSFHCFYVVVVIVIANFIYFIFLAVIEIATQVSCDKVKLVTLVEGDPKAPF